MLYWAAIVLATPVLGLIASASSYVLTDSFSGTNFFSQFDFFSDSDPTHGYVNYVDSMTASQKGLAGVDANGVAFIRADSQNEARSPGRNSVRITSKKSFTHGLVIADIAAMPSSTCGVWPAYWMVGPDWPSSGEIDIIEGVSESATSAVTLHTANGCAIDRSAAFTGNVANWDCYVYAANQPTNAGCSITASDKRSYGDGFNNVEGGVYAMEWTADRIAVWFFPRDNGIPDDVNSGVPQPSTWGTPLAQFTSRTCNLESLMKNLNIVFNITFCGDWAGNVWSSSACSRLSSSCQDFVAHNPQAFAQSQWKIRYLNVYKNM